MPNEINVLLNLAISKGGASWTGSLTKSKDLTGDDGISATQILSTAVVALAVGALAQNNAVFIKNLDATDSVKVGIDNAMANRFATIPPGSGIYLESPPALWVQATANTPRILVVACEN
jgi:hypothetical protein